MSQPDSCQQNKPDAFSGSEIQLSDCGQKQEISLLSVTEDEEVTVTTTFESTLRTKDQTLLKKRLSPPNDEKYVTVECQPETKKTILNDKSLFSENDTLITNLLETSEAVLTLREKVLKQFWSTQSKERSTQWWLPTKTDCVVSDLTLLNGSLKSFPEGKSWFSTRVTAPQNRSSSTTFYRSSTFSLPVSTDSESTKHKSKKSSKGKKEKLPLKTKKIALYPTRRQQEILESWFGAFRWFYNRTIDYTKENEVYDFFEVSTSMRINSKFVLPDWCENDIPPRVITGAISDCCKAYKTGFGQIKKGLITHFNLSYKTKKDSSQCLYLEKSCFGKKGLLPKFKIGNIRGVYKRNKIQLKDISINHDCRLKKRGNKYFLYVPEDNQFETYYSSGLISLDSGIRTFQTGYSLANHTVELGVDCSKHFQKQLDRVDTLRSVADTSTNKRKKTKLFSRIKRINFSIENKVNDLHWKTINFLTSNYKTIVVSDFQVASLLKNPSLNPRSKRTLGLMRHYWFKTRLIHKCEQRRIELYFVDESYTSKTCTCCGKQNTTLGMKKDFNCEGCGLSIDRDINAARNILNKNWTIVDSSPIELHMG